MEGGGDLLEAQLLGYVTRHRLVHSVRRDYERVVSEIQSTDDLKCLDLANQTVVWPRGGSLCYPVFQTTPHSPTRDSSQSEEKPPEDELASRSNGEHTACQTPPPRSPMSSQLSPSTPPQPSPSTTPHQSSSLPSPSPPDVTTSPRCSVGGGGLFTDLPRDREALLHLRSQLAMELLWVKQAIASRQQYLKLRDNLSCKPS